MIVSLVLASLVSFVPQAQAAVAFNTFPISYTQLENRDFSMIDARDVSAGGSLSTSQSDHDNGVSANAGDEIEFVIYYHNSGVAEDEATNTIIKATLPGGVRQSHEVSATIDSDQTSPISSADAFRGGNIVIYLSGNAQTLEFIQGSVKHFPNRATAAQIPQNGDSLIGSGLNIGTVKGCFEFSGFVTFRARVGGQVTETRGLSIVKRVLNVSKSETIFRDSTLASPGERLRFEVRFETTGSASQNNVIARDVLPGRLTRIEGSMREGGISVSTSYESDFFGAGRNFGTLPAGISKTITFETNVAETSQFTGTTNLVNTANVRSDQISTRQDDAEVTVQLVLGTSFALRKTAFNLTKGADATTVSADPGDIIVYTLYYLNTGQTMITGAVIEDNIHDVLELAEIVNQGGALAVNSVIRWEPITVIAGSEVSRSFQVRVRAVSLFPATSDLVMVNTYGNEIRVTVRRPQVAGITPARTGPAEWLAASLAGLVTAGYWVYRRKLKVESEKLKV
mgnify:CR=1 FL=1